MKIYIRKLNSQQCTNKSISVTMPIFQDFFEDKDVILVKGKKSGKFGDAPFTFTRNREDPRFGGIFKEVLRAEGNGSFKIGDILVVEKASPNYIISLVTENDSEYETYNSLLQQGFHTEISVDNEDNKNSSDLITDTKPTEEECFSFKKLLNFFVTQLAINNDFLQGEKKYSNPRTASYTSLIEEWRHYIGFDLTCTLQSGYNVENDNSNYINYDWVNITPHINKNKKIIETVCVKTKPDNIEAYIGKSYLISDLELDNNEAPNSVLKSLFIEYRNEIFKWQNGEYRMYKDIFSGFQEWLISDKNPDRSGNQQYSGYSRCLERLIEFMFNLNIIQDNNLNVVNSMKYKDVLNAYEGSDETKKFDETKLQYFAGRAALKKYIKYVEYLESSVEAEKDPEIFEPIGEYSKENFLDDVFMSSEEYDTLKEILEYKRNIILQGAPGVGKTFLAKRFAYSLMGETDSSRVKLVQFHQNYSYEDFIMGYKPNAEGFKLVDGVFYEFCQKAESDTRDHYFIIDEINRGNVSKIFGELMMLIENDKRGVEKLRLAYKDIMFTVPKNVYIIGMMNTADRSLAIMDYALRRRFSFYEVDPAFGKESFKNHLKSNGLSDGIIEKINDKFVALNTYIADEKNSGLGSGFRMGHSYFCTKPNCEENKWYDNIIKFEIQPMLEEYWFDEKDKVSEWMGKIK